MNIRDLLYCCVFIIAPGISMASTMPAQTEAIIKKLPPRAEVIREAQPDIELQTYIPAQYSICLYVSTAQSGKNNDAHEYIIGQIDFLSESGISAKRINGLISYGHALTISMFSSQVGTSIDKLNNEQFMALNNFEKKLFTDYSCVASAGPLQKILKEAVINRFVEEHK